MSVAALFAIKNTEATQYSLINEWLSRAWYKMECYSVLKRKSNTKGNESMSLFQNDTAYFISLKWGTSSNQIIEIENSMGVPGLIGRKYSLLWSIYGLFHYFKIERFGDRVMMSAK